MSALEYRRWLGESRQWQPQLLLIAALQYATLMAFPLAFLWRGSDFSGVTILVGIVLEVVRSAARRRLKRKVRGRFIEETARQALDKRVLVPEAEVESAFWAAFLLEHAITTDIPALVAATFAGVSIFALAMPVAGAETVLSLAGLSLATICLAMWTNRFRQPAIEEVVEQRQRVAAWVATAERDSGEIYGSRARAPFLARLNSNVQQWTRAEEHLEIGRMRQRLFLLFAFSLGVCVVLKWQHIDPFQLQSMQLSVGHASGLLLLSMGIPAAYVFVGHADSLLTAHGSLRQLLTHAPGGPQKSLSLPKRPESLKASAVHFSYPGVPTRAGLPALDFAVDLRRLTLIIAPNGSGKTTLARLICGVLTSDGGTLEIDGIACSEASRDDFGFVPQNPLIIDALTIEENVRLVSPDSTRAEIEQALLDLGLQRPLDQIAGALSRGEQRRVAIARAVLKRPSLLLLDEPDVWLDAEGRASLAHVLERQQAERAVLVVSHRGDWLARDAQVLDLVAQTAPATGTSSA